MNEDQFEGVSRIEHYAEQVRLEEEQKKLEALFLTERQIEDLRRTPGGLGIVQLRDAWKLCENLDELDDKEWGEPFCSAIDAMERVELVVAEVYWGIKRETCKTWSVSPVIIDRCLRESLEKLAAIKSFLEV